ncbi:purine nucleoside phosphorylase YfiH [Limnobaculum parvum]|uniref:Purine nucleoside phosphorylase n=1 Tax=Limnobaculum parvum TaxID=2172103 RepID=A0A2Y9U264_9GAMM|nr:purine nucleoside phosphorylase YfiH [Limnobaculum parvum]AWH89699.1 peptidoglycan editing factor PgeF [Limnobaculum parvum]
MIPLITPEWIAPAGVKAVNTTRNGGVSVAPYHTLNLGNHVGDEPTAVLQNRQRLEQQLNISGDITWLEQVHGVEVLTLTQSTPISLCADASYTRMPGKVCAIMTADCLPVLFCSVNGDEVAAAHAGWRGLQAGILERTIENFMAAPDNIIAWLGPAIGPTQFEVGPEVRDAFMTVNPVADSAFSSRDDKYLADIYLLARQRLQSLGIQKIYGGSYCTVSQPELFFSYRRERDTGRMVSLIWFD